jgi:hypothetical protein
MDFVFWIIAIVLIVGVVWWLLNRNSSANTGGTTPVRKDGGLAGGSAAASAEAAGTAGLPSAAGFGSGAEPTPPTTAADEREPRGTAARQGFSTADEPGGRAEAPSAPAAALHPTDTHPDSAAEQDAVGGHGAMLEPDAPAAPGPAPVEEPLAAGKPGIAAEPVAPPETTAPREDTAREDATVAEGTGGTGEAAARQAEEEWETQWSEASGSTPAASHRIATDAPADAAAGAATAHASAAAAGTVSADAQEAHGMPQSAGYLHHPEYTDAHAPTLPGAETAAADDLTADHTARDVRETPSAAGEPAVEPTAPAADYEPAVEPTAPATDYEPAVEPTGHLAADQPYGAGSASPGPDGSGPADFDVKGDAGAMVYYEEGHPDYEQTTADVWFESAAHAEAAGFRAPRRTRL